MKKLLLLTFLSPLSIFAQGYTSFFTGNTTNISTTTQSGICLMGGATENDNAMRWLLQKANGGDVVVIRSSGGSGYNNYFFSELGVTVNSVETLVITSVAGAINPYVLNKVANAELIWIAGGNQWNYLSFFKNNAFEDAINQHVAIKKAPIGGTSAGMAVLGAKYYSAQNGSVTSAQAMSNPYLSTVTLGNDDFLNVPFMQNVITDTHFDSPDRKGRLATFIARFRKDSGFNVKGIAANEYVAVCIDGGGIARVFGDHPNHDEFAYFVQADCNVNNSIENCQSGQALTWNFGGNALRVYKVPGTQNGTNFYNINVWEDAIGSGGSWEKWSVNNGVFSSSAATAPVCTLSINSNEKDKSMVFPNPFSDSITIENFENAKVEIFNVLGAKVYKNDNLLSNSIVTSSFLAGLYLIKINKDGKEQNFKIIKQ